MFDRLLPFVLIVLVVLGCVSGPSRNINTLRPNASPSPATTTAHTAGNQWDYSEFTDEMGRGKIYVNTIVSRNTISLEMPYEGAQHGKLSIREHPQHGKDVYVSIERGQLLDSDYHSKVLVRFDEDKPQSFSSSGPDDLSSEALFLRGAFPVFLNKLKTAKTLRIEVPVYQAGNQVLEFDVEGFTWKKQ
jgi:hypothetical protein